MNISDSGLEVCRRCEGGMVMSPAECSECEGEVMIRYKKPVEPLPSNPNNDPTDWLAYLEVKPHTEPYLSIARAWRADKAEIERLRYAIGRAIGCLDDEGLWGQCLTDLRKAIGIPSVERPAHETVSTPDLLTEMEDHVQRIACWCNPGDVFAEVRRWRDEIIKRQNAQRAELKANEPRA